MTCNFPIYLQKQLEDLKNDLNLNKVIFNMYFNRYAGALFLNDKGQGVEAFQVDLVKKKFTHTKLLPSVKKTEKSLADFEQYLKVLREEFLESA